MLYLDTLTLEGANMLAEQIRQHWVEAGYPEIQTRLEEIVQLHHNGGRTSFGFGVRSNMVGGIPPRSAAT